MERHRKAFWNLLLAASFTAAIVSLLTTALGLGNYLHPLLAWPLALAVQAGLFGLAWLIAVPKGRLRWLLITLYTITMPFSVVFSYVMLQSELTAETKTLQARRALVDDLRERSATVSDEIQRSIAWSEDLRLRLDSWLALERSEGWTAATCAEADHPYCSSRTTTGHGPTTRRYSRLPLLCSSTCSFCWWRSGRVSSPTAVS